MAADSVIFILEDSIARIGDVIAAAVVNSNNINVEEQGGRVEEAEEPYLAPTYKQVAGQGRGVHMQVPKLKYLEDTTLNF